MFLYLCAFYFWFLLIQAVLQHGWPEPVSLTFQNLVDLKDIIVAVFLASIIEELLFRYWVYGRKTRLRIGFFIGFGLTLVLNALTLIIGSREGWLSWVEFLGIPLFSLSISLALPNSESYDKIVTYFNRLNRSWIFFGAMVFLFALAHLQRFEDAFYFGFWWHFLSGGALITYFAKCYGIGLAIVVHMLTNSIITLGLVRRYHTLGLMHRDYFYLLFPISIALILVYHWWIRRLQKDPEFRPVDAWLEKSFSRFTKSKDHKN